MCIAQHNILLFIKLEGDKLHNAKKNPNWMSAKIARITTDSVLNTTNNNLLDTVQSLWQNELQIN